MTATLQLAMPGIDARRDELTDAEIAAAEAVAAHQAEHVADLALAARRCRCGRRAWGEPRERRCVRCGHDHEEDR